MTKNDAEESRDGIKLIKIYYEIKKEQKTFSVIELSLWRNIFVSVD